MSNDALQDDELYNSFQKAAFVKKTEDGWLFDLGEERAALVPSDDLLHDPEYAPGDEVELLVERPYAGNWAASVSKLEKLRQWDEIQQIAEEQGIVEGLIVGANKGGLSVDIGLRAFVPMSQIDIHRVNDTSPYIGRTERFRVIEFDKKRCNVVLSRRKLLEKERREERGDLLEQLEAGQEYDGVVRNVVDFGVFVDIGGVEGLLHSSNMSWGRVDHPSELFGPGDDVRVVVLDWKPERDRLSLGRKQLLSDPWVDIEERYEEGQIVDGNVVSLADFGAFVAVEDGLEGLAHVTELSWADRTDHPRDVLSIGQTIQVKIIGVDSENRRLSLSVKQLEPNPWEKLVEGVEVGSTLTGPITNVVDFGLFVEMRPGVEGLVHVSDLSWTERIDDPSEHYDVGDEVEVKVLEIDVDAGQASLGIKQLSRDPWEKVTEVANVGEKIEVTITRLAEFGAFAEIVDGVEGLIHISELADRRVERPAEVVRPGQTREVLVLGLDRSNQRVSLSLKRDQLEHDDVDGYEDEGSATALGDVLRNHLGLEDAGPADQEE